MTTKLFQFAFIRVAICVMALISSVPLALAADPKKPDTKGAAPVAAETSPAVTPGEMVCQSDVHYVWELRRKSPASNAEAEELTAFFTTVSEQGMVEKEARSRLSTKLASVEAEALDYCRVEHQDQAGCLRKKLARVANEYNSVDFAQRKLIMQSVLADCGGSIGSCLQTHATPIRCWKNVSPDVQEPFAAPLVSAAPQIPVGEGGEVVDEATGEVATDDNGTPITTSASATVKPVTVPVRKRPVAKAVVEEKEDKNSKEAQPLQTPDNPYSKPFAF